MMTFFGTLSVAVNLVRSCGEAGALLISLGLLAAAALLLISVLLPTVKSECEETFVED